MSELSLARSLVIVLLTAFFGGVIAKKIKLPLVVGYLLGGMIVGSFINHFIPLGETIEGIAQMGVALLLFSLGLEFSLSKLKELGDVIIFGSFIQVILTTLVGVVIFPFFFGMDFYTALFLGAVFSLSSTAVVVKSLSERGELETLHGEMAVGWLFMQDLYTLPLIIFLPALGQLVKNGELGTTQIFMFSRSLFLTFISFLLIIIAGKKIFPAIIDRIADFKSRELLLIGVVAICLAFAFLFQFLGFSFAIGAFVAGVLIASSSARHGIFAEVRPLRDIFATVFFVSLGFLLNPVFFLKFWPTILILVLIIILIKFILSAILVLILGYHSKIAFLVGISLVSVGEFAFILALLGASAKLITQETYFLILSTSFITLVISAPFISASEIIYYKLKRFIHHKIPKGPLLLKHLDRFLEPVASKFSDHVVVLGYGRVGKYICRALESAQIPFLVIDYNHQIVKKLQETGTEIIYGDPAEIDVLQFAKVKEAKVIILAYPDRQMQETIVTNILSLNPKTKLICRVHFEEDQQKLKSLGAYAVVQPEFEAAVTITSELLSLFNTPSDEIKQSIKRLKIEHGL